MRGTKPEKSFDEDNMVEDLMGTIQGELRQLALLLREI